jgi:hypothetical protein
MARRGTKKSRTCVHTSRERREASLLPLCELQLCYGRRERGSGEGRKAQANWRGVGGDRAQEGEGENKRGGGERGRK